MIIITFLFCLLISWFVTWLNEDAGVTHWYFIFLNRSWIILGLHKTPTRRLPLKKATTFSPALHPSSQFYCNPHALTPFPLFTLILKIACLTNRSHYYWVPSAYHILTIFVICIIIVSSTDLVSADRSSAIPEKIVSFYRILRLNLSLLLTEDSTLRRLLPRKLEPSFSCTHIECVGADDAAKAFPEISKAVGKQSIYCNHVMIKASLAECLCQLVMFLSLKGLTYKDEIGLFSVTGNSDTKTTTHTMHMFPRKLRKNSRLNCFTEISVNSWV